MLIIKPYGRSHVEPDGTKRRRTLHLNTAPKEPQEIAKFAGSDPRLVIAQWVSMIDKIARKPKPDKKPTCEQRAFRDKLGQACWELIEQEKLIPELEGTETRSMFHTLWWSKIRPYPKGDFPPKGTQPAFEGRWYKRFAGETKPENVNHADIARKIYEHLYVAEYRIKPTSSNKHKGLIEARAETINKNVLKQPQEQRALWDEKDEATYLQAGDIGRTIYEAAKAEYNKEGHHRKPLHRRLSLSEAGEVFFAQYGRLFSDKSGTPLSIKAAETQHTGLFNLHMAVKDFYKRRLKHSKRQNILTSLPKDGAALFALLKAGQQNRDLAGLVRLGKIIHYEMSHQAWNLGTPNSDEIKELDRLKCLMTSWSKPDRFKKHWPKRIEESTFWTSKGQAEIQRQEAFVRIWRHIMTLANRTLTDWGYPDTHINHDIFEGHNIDQTVRQVSAEQHQRKLDLLFGKHGRLLASNGLAPRILETAINRMAHLRNHSLHFTDKRIFATALTRLTENVPNIVKPSLSALWRTDEEGRAAAIGAAMKAVHTSAYFDEAQNRHIFTSLRNAETSLLPLPRFSRMVARANDAWKKDEKDRPSLPAPANRLNLEDPARLCQYATIKQLYEGPFRHWLEEQKAGEINRYIRQAVAHTDKGAKDINGRKKSEKEKALIVSKATQLPRLDAKNGGETIKQFFFHLSARTATEMRVQRGYQSDAENAQKQAEYIEELKCDVIALALSDYLNQKGFTFILKLEEKTPLPPTEINLEAVTTPSTRQSASVADWQTVLYFLLHLIPVDEASKLLHQIRKWMVLEELPQIPTASTQAAEKIIYKTVQTLELYLAMHDAKFEGGMNRTGIDGFKTFYESEDGFQKLFSNSESVEDRTVPRRGLREVMRFGHLPLLTQICGKQKITDQQITEWETANKAAPGNLSRIAEQQHTRETLHTTYAGATKKFSIEQIKNYAKALSFVSTHRLLAAQVTLTNHIRAHRLMTAVLARLADYAGLWERDLYFVTLALCYQNKHQPDAIFNQQGLQELAKRQPIKAQWQKLGNAESNAVEKEITRYFGNVHVEGNRDVRTRNDLAHFNMLQGGKLNLTEWVNRTRLLMRHDRKMKNAVTQSVRELLAREGLDLTWQMDASARPHWLHQATLAVRYATHLQKISSLQPKLMEPLHGKDFVDMIATLFNGTPEPKIDTNKKMDVTDLDLNRLHFVPKKGGTNDKKTGRKA
ncbi:MAG: type VI-A CRISPR-associated RNA-guided ribonuclease Cas13a [Parvibaculum sp.]